MSHQFPSTDFCLRWNRWNPCHHRRHHRPCKDCLFRHTSSLCPPHSRPFWLFCRPFYHRNRTNCFPRYLRHKPCSRSKNIRAWCHIHQDTQAFRDIRVCRVGMSTLVRSIGVALLFDADGRLHAH